MLNQVVRLVRMTALGLFLSAIAFCQSQTGSMSGTILDANGAVVPDASVDATSAGTGVTLHTVSSEFGLYVFPNLPPGIWTVTVEKAGFKKLVRPDIQIFIAGRQALDLQLEVGDVKQSVEVTATQPLLETETSSRGQTLTPKMYQTLPLWFGGLQNPSAFLTYMSGVNSGSELSIAGSTGRARAVDRRHNERYCRVGRHRVQSALGRGVQRGQVADRTVLR